MIVADASAVVLALRHGGHARELLTTEAVVVPHLADAEVANAFRSLERRGAVPATDARSALRAWQALGVLRMATTELLPRVWTLRANLSASDATYVALAEALEVDLATADARLAGAPGPSCAIRVIRS